MALGDGIGWDDTTPTDSTLAIQIDDYMRGFAKGVRFRLAQEHEFPATQSATAEAGKHKFITLQMQSTMPTISGTQVGAVYQKTVATTGDCLFFVNAATQEINISDKVYYWYIGGDAVTGTNVNANLILVGTGKFKDIQVRAGTAPTGAALQLDLNYNGVSLWTATASQPILQVGSTSTSITTFVTTIGTAGGIMTIDCDTIGSVLAGANVTMMVRVG
jgi:hypothetical protein